jgi:hypothetical protein
MRASGRIPAALLGALAISVIAPRPALAQDADAQEVLRFTLTDAGLARYTQATKKLAALPAGTGECDDGNADSQSLDEMAARLKALPGAQAALQSAGMTSREYIVFSMSLLQNGMAAWAVKQPGGSVPPGVSKANVDFVNRHEAELKTLEGLTRKDECDDGAAGD